MRFRSPLSWLKSVRQDGWAAVSLGQSAVSRLVMQSRHGKPPRVLAAEVLERKGSDADALVRLQKSARLDRHRVTTVLNLGEYQMLQVDPPQVPEAELTQAIRWQVKGMLEFSVDEATIDVLLVPELDGRKSQVFALCAPNKVVEKNVRLYQEAKVPLEVIEVPETVQRNVAKLFEPEGRGLAMVGFYEHGGLLTFTYAGNLYSYRRLDVSLPQLLESGDEARQSLFDRILLEVQRSLDTFEHQFHVISVSKLLVSPLPAEVELRDFLSANFYLPVETADLAQVLDLELVPALRDLRLQAQLLPLIGAALRDESGGAA
jgi:MSHA biogenesis protein MshI